MINFSEFTQQAVLKEVTQKAFTVEEKLNPEGVSTKDYTNILNAIKGSYTLPGALGLLKRVIKSSLTITTQAIVYPILLIPAAGYLCTGDKQAKGMFKLTCQMPVQWIKDVSKLPKHVLQMVPFVGIFLARAYSVARNFLKYKVVEGLNFIARQQRHVGVVIGHMTAAITKKDLTEGRQYSGFKLICVKLSSENTSLTPLIVPKASCIASFQNYNWKKVEYLLPNQELVEAGLVCLEKKAPELYNELREKLEEFNDEAFDAHNALVRAGGDRTTKGKGEAKKEKHIALEKIRLWLDVTALLGAIHLSPRVGGEPQDITKKLLERLKEVLLEAKKGDTTWNPEKQDEIREVGTLMKIFDHWMEECEIPGFPRKSQALDVLENKIEELDRMLPVGE